MLRIPFFFKQINCLRLFFLVFFGFHSYASLAQYTLLKIPNTDNIFVDGKIFIDETHIWFSTFDGVAHFDGTVWEQYDIGSGLSVDSVTRIAKDANGSMLLLGHWGINRLKNGTWQFFSHDNGRATLERIADDIWLSSTGSYLHKITSTDTTTYQLPTEWWDSAIEVERNSNNIYYAMSASGVLSVMDNNSTWKVDATIENSFWHPNTFHIDKYNTLWATGNGKLFSKKTGDDSFSLVSNAYLSSVEVYSITSDQYGVLYLGTSDGLVIRNNDSWSRINVVEEGANPTVFDAKIDKSRNVWMTTKEGLVLLSNTDPTTNENRLTGKIFDDANNNGEQEENEPGLEGQFIKVEPAGVFVISNSKGEFSFQAESGTNKITWISKSYWETTKSSYSFTFPLEEPNGFNFPLRWKTVNDIAVSLVGNPIRPGFNFYNYINYANKGSASLSSTISFTHDPAITFIKSDITPTSIEGNTLKWDVTNLPIMTSQRITLEFNTPVSVSLGTAIVNKVEAEPLVGEVNLINNIDSLNLVVTGSFDPNDKAVTEGITAENLVLLNTKLTYTIRFQNTGTDTAFVVKVRDELDPSFDVTSFEILGASHPIEYSLNERMLLFQFDNIKLPDSVVDEPKSHGYIRYRIGHKKDLPNNTIVKNSAEIFFDFNQPVLTNEVSNKFVNELPTNRVTLVSKEIEMGVSIHPNPSKNRFTINDDLSTIDFVELLSSQGRVVKIDRLVSDELAMDDYPAGIYIIRIHKKSGIKSYKLILER